MRSTTRGRSRNGAKDRAGTISDAELYTLSHWFQAIKRPVLLLGHSFGGIVIKKVFLTDERRHLRSAYKINTGYSFSGTEASEISKSFDLSINSGDSFSRDTA